MKQYIPSILIAFIIYALLAVGFYFGNKAEVTPFGSVSVSDEYRSTIVGSEVTTVNGVALKPAPGVLGSVVITGANSSALTFYNATTSDVTLRALATTSLEILANIPGATVAGTYTFDIVADIGIVLDIYPGGTAPTSTITYR